MATPQLVEEMYDQIYHDAITTCTGSRAADTGDYAENALKDATKKYPFMKGKTVKQLLYYITKKQNTEKRRAWQQDKPTEKDFWDAAYEFDPLRQDPGSGPSRLVQLLTPSRFDVLPLGKLYNDIDLGLIPEIGALPESEIRTEDFTTFSPAASDSGAISYSDGHPSEVILPSDMMQPNEDKKLRRFASLGWVVKKSITKGRTIWTMTGHVLVMDMDRGRDHHPWFVLAHEWPNDDNEGSQEDFKHHVPKKVQRNARGAAGVFPGDHNRTPIAKIIFTRDNQPQEDDKRPSLKRFESDFEFTLERRGGDRPIVESNWGPGLAHVMTWYWDEEKEEEVCYLDDGGEYMRYRRDPGLYYYPRVNSMWADGEQGFFGELHTGTDEVVSRLSLGEPRQLPSCQLNDSSGFYIAPGCRPMLCGSEKSLANTAATSNLADIGNISRVRSCAQRQNTRYTSSDGASDPKRV